MRSQLSLPPSHPKRLKSLRNKPQNEGEKNRSLLCMQRAIEIGSSLRCPLALSSLPKPGRAFCCRPSSQSPSHAPSSRFGGQRASVATTEFLKSSWMSSAKPAAFPRGCWGWSPRPCLCSPRAHPPSLGAAPHGHGRGGSAG